MHYKDSVDVSGYFATIIPTREADVKVSFPVDKTHFQLADSASFKGSVISDAGGQLYFVLLYKQAKNKDEKVVATLAKIYRSDGLAWSVNYVSGIYSQPKFHSNRKPVNLRYAEILNKILLIKMES